MKILTSFFFKKGLAKQRYMTRYRSKNAMGSHQINLLITRPFAEILRIIFLALTALVRRPQRCFFKNTEPSREFSKHWIVLKKNMRKNFVDRKSLLLNLLHW